METLPRLPGTVLPAFLAQLQRICPATLQGLYLTGSVAQGDYHDRKSDIDFLVLLTEDLAAAQLAQCAALHQRLEKQYHHPNLNGYYLTLAGLASESPRFPSFFEGRLHAHRPFELDKITLLEWRTTALTLFGPPAQGLPLPLTSEAVRAQLLHNSRTYWRTWVARHTFPQPGYWQLALFPRLSEWSLLGVARQRYTLDTQQIASKYAAGHYCLGRLPAQYQAVVSEALETRQTNQTQLRPSFARANATLACLTYLLAAIDQLPAG